MVLKRLRPAGRLLGCLALRWGVLVLDVDKTLLGPILMVLNPLAWVLATWAVCRLIDLDRRPSRRCGCATARTASQFTEMVWPVGSVATKIALALALMLHLMALFAWDVTAVLTGLGIGGVAFALGAQDSLRNLFGSFTLLADRPFVVGETVQIGEGGLGVVERVGLRSTSIRTVEDTLMVVPNSNLTTMNITNFGRRRFRRFTGRIAVAYGTSRQRLAAFRDGLRRMALQLKWTRKDQCEVAIHDLTTSAIEIQISVYFDVTTSHEEAAAREALLLGCLRVAEELRIDLAVPMHPASSRAGGGGRFDAGLAGRAGRRGRGAARGVGVAAAPYPARAASAVGPTRFIAPVPQGDGDHLAEPPKNGLLHIGDPVLRTERLQTRLRPLVLPQGQVGPDVMLDLVVEPAVQHVVDVAAAAVVDGADDLAQVIFALAVA